MATKKSSYGYEDDEENEDSSGSDFDDDEDPDEIEVPGGGRDLATVATLTKQKVESDLKVPASGQPASNVSSKSTGKIPIGLVTKPVTSGGYEVIRQPTLHKQPGVGSSVGMAATLGFGGSSSMNNANHMTSNQIMLEQLKALVAANPHYLTSGIPTNLLSQIWMADTAKVQQQQQPMFNNLNQPAEEEEAEEEEMGVAETYAEYWPAKLKIGKKHPDPVVETASLSSVEPSDVYYKISIPPEPINAGQLSALQLESITYASQAHDHLLADGSRAGFLVGDGAGVGKGRTIAGIIYENYLKGRKKAIWISVSNDLRYDAERDLRDIGASRIHVYALNKLKYAKINSSANNNTKKGVIFGTYSALIGESQSTTGKYKTRLKQLLQWCGDDFAL